MIRERFAACPSSLAHGRRGVTLLELLISMVVVALLMVLTMQIVSSISSLWIRMSGRVESFAAARAGFDAMTRSVEQATLKSYFAYADASGNPVPLINPSSNLGGLDRSKIPTKYLRASDLHFLVEESSDILAGASSSSTPGYAIFFQAPLGRGAIPPSRREARC